ncbi:hypothetical protein BH09ACT10_BH09ACT10_19390 [soil metagenome]
MDVHSLVRYVDELEIQAGYAQLAEPALRERASLGAAQSILTAGAIVSMLLWPSEPTRRPGASPEELALEKEATRNRGKRLREQLTIDGLPTLRSRPVRNAFESFDVVLDRWLEDDPVRATRSIDPETLIVSILGETVDLRALLDELATVADAAQAWKATH